MRVARATIHRHSHFLRDCAPFYGLFTALSFPSSSKNRDTFSLSLSLPLSVPNTKLRTFFFPFAHGKETEDFFVISVDYSAPPWDADDGPAERSRTIPTAKSSLESCFSGLESRTIRMCHLPRLCCSRHASVAWTSLCRRQHYNFTSAFTVGTYPRAARDLSTCWHAISTCIYTGQFAVTIGASDNSRF